MTITELIECLEICQQDAEVYIASPDGDDDYFLDRVRVESASRGKGTVVFLETSQ